MPRGGQPGTPALVHRTFKTKPLQIKPLRIKRSPVHHAVLPQLHRSSALATREGGIGAQPHWTAAQRRQADKLVSGYEAGPRIGGLGHALEGEVGSVVLGLAHAYQRNRVLGHKGLGGGVEDLVKTFNPVPIAHTLVKDVRHPLASRSATGLNAGIVVGGPGGLRLGGVARELTRPRTRAEAEARLATLEAQQAKFQKGLEGQYKSVLPDEQLRLSKAKGVARKAAKSTKPIKGGKKAARVQQPMGSVADEFLQRTVDEIVVKHPEHPAVKAYLRNVNEANQLREALNAQHLPGDTPVVADYGSVRVPAPQRGPLVPPAKVADVPNLPGAQRGAVPLDVSPQDLVAKSLSSAERLRGQQKQMYREELGKRVAKAQAAAEKAGGGIAGNEAALRQLRGELPKTTFDNLRNGRINQADLETLVRHVDNHPELSFFDKITVNKALRDAVENGRTPAPHEIKLMRTAFGPEVADTLSQGFKAGRFVMDIANVPRSIMASLDVSAPFRQGLVAGAGHPKLFAKNFPPMFRSLVSEPHYQGLLDEIHARPNSTNGRYEVGRVAFTELRGKGSKNREEQFSSDFAEKVPLLGHIIRASGRAYTGFLDRTRADVFDSLIETAKKKHINVDDPEFLRSLGLYVNAATGRGELPGKAMQSAAPALNTLFFSPRLMYSRINFLDPTWYLRGPKYGGLDKFARRQALKSFATLGAGSALALALAGEYTRAKIGTDPRSADFAKLRLGNTRVDTLGGFQQYVRLAAQLEQGKIVSSTTGRTLNLGHGFGDLSRKDILQRFAEGKLAPTPSLINDFLKGTTFAGAPFSAKQAIVSRIVPLVAQDALDLQRSGHSIPLTALGYGISAFGIGMQTYEPKKKGPKKLPNPFLDTKPTESKSNPYLPGSSSSDSGSTSSNPYMP